MEMQDSTAREIREVNDKVSSILQLLKGHELDKDDKGMVGIQNDHEARIVKLERLIDKGKYFLIGLCLPAGWGVADILVKIFTK